ncbi:hypothetical protein BGW38_007078 [Lunasporangiospora selenospora]|uniref:K Homology domain-containing protein n=1 Tax=Lunasporangiospora selenospora TaxID=979761 RepID=A0A9P6FZV6_9FUNG|nr:hypothetical protein BGW38_007078 [Lunasporangiospora selenospora]
MISSSSSDTPSAALRMQMLHEAQTSGSKAAAAPAPAPVPAPVPVNQAPVHEPVLASASESRLYAEDPAESASQTPVKTTRAAQNLDFSSTLLFPSLGSASPAPRPAAAQATWGAGPSSRVKSAAPSAPSSGKLGAVGDQRRTVGVTTTTSTKVSSSGNVQERMEIPTDQMSGFGFGHRSSTVGDIIKTVMISSGARIESTTSQATRMTTFLISGKPETVAKARHGLRSSFAKKENVKYAVPSSARPHLLGSKGKTLINIQKNTGVTINVPKREQTETSFEPAVLSEDDLDAEEEQVFIDIEGDIESIKAAKEEIDAIVSKACRITYRLTTIPTAYYPFISGTNKASVQQQTNTRINMPFHISSQDNEDDEEARDTAIVIQGERKAIRKAIEIITTVYEELERTTRTMTINIPKRQHRFLVGVKGASINEIHAATGCTIEIPPVDSPSDSIVVRGPESELIPALSLIMEKANSSQVESVDVGSVHKVAANKSKREHARHVTKYLSARNKLRKIEQEHDDVQISVPRQDGQIIGTIEIVAKTRAEVDSARLKVLEAINTLKPSLFDVIHIEPLLHRHIVGNKGRNINRIREAHGVEVIVPDTHSDSTEVVLVFEGKEEGDLADVSKARSTLEAVKQELEKLANDATDFSTRVLSIPARLHGTIIGPKGSTLNAIMGLEPTTSVRLGLPRDGSTDTVKKSGAPVLNEDSIVVKGPKEEVERVAREIITLAEEAKHQQIMNSYTVTFDIPATASPHVIGKGGANINKLTEQFQVKFDLNDRAAGADDKKKKSANDMMEVTIQGVKKSVEAAKETIVKMVEQIADATVVLLTIPVEYHSAMIGSKGQYVRRLEDKYAVRIQFPKAADLQEDEDSSKLNVVRVSGGKKGVQAAKGELMELLEYEKENNNTLEMIVEPKMLPHIVGRSGAKINEIQQNSGTHIEIRRSSEADEKPEVRVVINGTKAGLKKAQKAVQDILDAQKSQVEELVPIDIKYHRILIGPGGSTLRDIIAKAGGPPEPSAQAGLVKFQSANNAVLLKGDKTVVEKLKEVMLAMVTEHDNHVTVAVAIPAAQHRQVIGPQFSNVKEIENRHNGQRENCEKAKVELEAKIKVTSTRSFSIPKKYRQAVYGEGVWKIRNEFGVVVVQPKETRNVNGGKRIDVDDENTVHGLVEGLAWELSELSNVGSDSEEADAQWTVQLQGKEEACVRVEEHLTRLLERAQSTTHRLRISVPTSYHGVIIGSGGNNIKQIEIESQTTAKIVRGEEQITITGSKEGVEKAKASIVRIVGSLNK